MSEVVPMPVLPPSARSRVALGLTAAAALGRFELQVCRDCSAVQYPPREACCRCLSANLDWRVQSGDGELISETTLQHSHNEYFRERLPWRIGMVRLDCGPTAIVHLHGAVPSAPARVRVKAHLDKAGQAALVAFPAGESSNMTGANRADDRQVREITCDPKSLKVLVTQGTTAVGQSLVRALVAAGAAHVWVGYSERRGGAGSDSDEISRLKQVSLLPLDLTSSQSVEEA